MQISTHFVSYREQYADTGTAKTGISCHLHFKVLAKNLFLFFSPSRVLLTVTHDFGDAKLS